MNTKNGKINLFGITLFGLILAYQYRAKGKEVVFYDNDPTKWDRE